MSEVWLAIAELIRKPKLGANAEGDFESALLSAAQDMALIDRVSVEFGTPEIGDNGWGCEAYCHCGFAPACRKQTIGPLNLRLQKMVTEVLHIIGVDSEYPHSTWLSAAAV